MKNLSECVLALEKAGQLKKIDYPVSPKYEMGLIQRLAFKAEAPALLFTRPQGCKFPMLANLFATRKRVELLFGKNLERLKVLFDLMASDERLLKKSRKIVGLLPWLNNVRPHCNSVSPARQNSIPVLQKTCALSELPHLYSWQKDGGAFITLPIVQSENPATHQANWGMYRIQLNGNSYGENEIGMHYQLKRGIGIHHAESLREQKRLPIHIYAGGPPAMTLAAIMPLPEAMDELGFAGLLAGQRIRLSRLKNFALPVLGEADFLITGSVGSEVAPEGPFGDHLGYYSLRHSFPVMKVSGVYHRPNAIWPFTTVGRPPQEDTIFGDIIHEITAPMTKKFFGGISQIHAVDAAGVHPLLLAIGSERYVPYNSAQCSLELITQGLHLLGTTQTALAKFLLICDAQQAPTLDVRDIESFFRYFLERTDYRHDLHFITSAPLDTLDYTGTGLNEGSKLLWTASGIKKRILATSIAGDWAVPSGFANPQIVMPGIMAVEAAPHCLQRSETDGQIENCLCPALENWKQREGFPLVVLVDDSRFAAKSLENFLWVTFTRADPSCDVYGASAKYTGKHWACESPLVIDARVKKFHAPVLEDDPEILAKVKKLAAGNGPLHGLF